MPEEQENPDVLGEEWGALAGHSPTDGLRVYQGHQAEMVAENKRLREEAAELQRQLGQQTPAPTQKVDPEPSSVDLEAIRGDDPKKAAEELTRHTREVVGDVVSERMAERDKLDFPTKRQQAMAVAAETIRQQGGDFSKYQSKIEQAMAGKGVAPETQTNANHWVQSYITLEGLESMKGVQPETPGAPHVERPTPNSPQPRRNKAVLTSAESEVRDNFARVAGENISDEEWRFYQDTGRGPDERGMSIEDHEEFVLAQADRQKKGRR